MAIRPIAALALAISVAALTAMALVGPVSAADAARKAPPKTPNVIVVETDDQAVSAWSRSLMPRTFDRFVDGGIEFTDSIAATPLCCPSRAVLATGQYGHNNGVLRNTYVPLVDKPNVLPAWLQRAGYRTIHVGRFFNGYEGGGRRFEIAPGWDVWRTSLTPRRYYDYKLYTNSGARMLGVRDRDHLTVTLNRIAVDQIKRKAPKKRPFYLQLDHFAPHNGPGSRDGRCNGSPVPAGPDEQAFLGEPAPRGPAYDEKDISDKPAFMRGLRSLSPEDDLRIERNYGCALASLQSVDRGMERIFQALRKTKSLRDTAVIYTSDNGFLYGEHRIALEKQSPYEEPLRVPLAMRLPGNMSGPDNPRSSDATVANIDLAPTILELANAQPCLRTRCRTLDGRSLLGEATGESGTIPADRAISLELQSQGIPLKGLTCVYRGIRTSNEVYVEHTGARESLDEPCEPYTATEHYDIAADPAELDNLFPAPPFSPLARRQQDLSARVSRLEHCAGIAGRDPLPPTGQYCE